MSRTNKIVAVVAVLTLSLPAMASNGFTPSISETGGAAHAMQGGLTPAQVQAELAAAQRTGMLEKMYGQTGYAAELTGASGAQSRTRQEVIVELQNAIKDGTLREMNRDRSN